MTEQEIWGLIIGSYTISIILVLFAGIFPSDRQNWETIHWCAIGTVVFIWLASLSIAFPALMILFLIIAATTKRGPS